jgi:hypothetical protein
MKKIIKLFILIVIATNAKAQVLEDFGRVVLNTYLPEKLALPAEAKNLLATKLSQITSTNGIGGSQVNPRFIITANINVGTKDVIAGPPQLIAQNLDITLFIGDALSNTIFANTTLSLKGVGTNENKAFIDALKMINPKNKEITSFLEEGKNKIINYYISQCDFILKDADALTKQYKFSEAILLLMTVPAVSKDCHFKAKDLASIIFNQKIDSDCSEKLKEAKLIWASAPNEIGATKIADILTKVIPSTNCRNEIAKLSEEIKKHFYAEKQKKYNLEMLQMQKSYATEQRRLEAIKEIAIAQTQTITYNNIYWR